MKNYYLRLVFVNKNYNLIVYSTKGKPLDIVGSYLPGTGVLSSSILRVHKSSLLFWISKGLRPTLLLKKLLILSSII